MRNVYFFLLINFCFSVTGAKAQSLQQSLAKADSLLAAGNADDALKTYKRVLFFADTSFEVKQHIYSKSAICYFRKNQFDIAAEQYTYALLYSNSGFDKNKYRLQRAKALLMAKKFDDARQELDKVDTINFPVLIHEYHFYKGTLAFAEENYELAEKEFIYLAAANPSNQKEIKKLFKLNRKNNRKSATAAAVMSVIVPGSGQVYAGEVEKGINSLLLTSAWLVLGYNTAIVYGIEHALIAIAPWYIRYYTSGIKKAAQLTNQKKLEKREQVLQQLLKLSTEK